MKDKGNYAILIIVFMFLFGCKKSIQIKFVSNCYENGLITKIMESFSPIGEEDKYKIVMSKEKYLKLLDIFYSIITITRRNLDNYNSTKGFKPVQIIFNEEDLSIDVQELNLFNYYYNPSHPDAEKYGEEKGYVKYPRINYNSELQFLFQYISCYNSIAKANIYNDIVINTDVYSFYLRYYINKKYNIKNITMNYPSSFNTDSVINTSELKTTEGVTKLVK